LPNPVTVAYIVGKFQNAIKDANPNIGDPSSLVAVDPVGKGTEVTSAGKQGLGYTEFRLAGRFDIDSTLKRINETFAALPEFESFSSFGPQAAGEMQLRALGAVILSWGFIIFWIGYRFSNWSFGMGGVAALVHDVLMSMGLVAIVSSLAVAVPSLEALFITDMKINLDMVAAILTLIGYSIHDTIVTFDRVRELRGKGSKVTPEMINRAINETLSRTIITSLLTWGTVFVLFLGGGAALRGFSFLLVVGLISGTYSTIFIANPVVLWILSRFPHEGTSSAPSGPQSQPAA
jgi:SecD/SecF fusion protein